MLRAAGSGAAPRLLAASAVAVSVTGTGTETALATITIPAGAMGLNGAVEIRTSWSMTNSANTKTHRIRHGGIGGTAHASIAVTTFASLELNRRIRNRGSASSQVGTDSSSATAPGANGGALVTASVDTSVASDIVITGQLGLSSETITLEMYEVWLLP